MILLMNNTASAIEYFDIRDQKIAQLVKNYSKTKRVIKKSPPEHYARELFASIVSQQLSTKVADVIWERFSKLVKNPDDPKIVKRFTVEQLRSVGLSNQKAN